MRIVEREVIDIVQKMTRTIRDDIYCDICGELKSDSAQRHDGEVDWSASNMTITETAVYQNVGYTTPEGGLETVSLYHICPTCWPKLVEFIESFREARPTVITKDW